jgi:tight adherence protein C
MPTGGPTLLGVDVIWVATILSGVATLAVLTAIYAATTVKDPMARRVKALNERREQLKAGIVASTNKSRSRFRRLASAARTSPSSSSPRVSSPRSWPASLRCR